MLQSELPASSGFPSITPNAPAIATPDAPLGASQLLGGGISQVGAGLSQAGQLLTAREDLKARTQHADALLGSKKAGLATTPGMQTMLDKESGSEDYETLPDRVMTEGKRLIADGGAHLTGRALELYSLDMTEKLNAYHQKSIDVARGKREQVKGFVLAETMKQSEQDIYNAPTIYHRLVAQDALETTMLQMVEARLVTGVQGRDYLQKVYDDVQVQDVKKAIRQNPDTAVVALNNLVAGKPTAEGFPVPPPAQLTLLRDEAFAQSKVLVQAAEHAEQVTAWRAGQAGQAIEQDYRSKISALDPTPANLPTLRQLLDAANTPEQRRAMGPQAHQDITTLLRGTINMALGEDERQKAAAGKPKDDPTTEYDLRIGIALAKTPEQIRAMEARVLAAGQARSLTPETFSAMEARIMERRNQASPTNRVSYREGVTFIERAAIVPGGFGGMGLEAETKRKLLVALDAYEVRYRQMVDDKGVDAADLAAYDLAQEVRFTHFPPVKESMPPALRDAKNDNEAAHALEQMRASGMTVVQLKAYRELWRKSQDDDERRRKWEEEQRHKSDAQQRRR